MQKFKVNWSVDEEVNEFDVFSDKQLEHYRVAVFDRWNWETGTEEDWELVQRIEFEQKRREALKFEEEMVNALAKDIRDEIDQQILKDLKALADEPS